VPRNLWLIGSVTASTRDGLRDLRRMPTLVSVTVIIVALTTVFVLMYPLLEQVVGVGDAEVIRRSEVIVLLDEVHVGLKASRS